jgi:cyclic nucleotide gated channel
VLGAAWYLLSVERQDTCWIGQCRIATTNIAGACVKEVFDCKWSQSPGFVRPPWYDTFSSASSVYCNGNGPQDPNSPTFIYGIYQNAISMSVSSIKMRFSQTYFYCLWVGLLSLRYVNPLPFHLVNFFD